MKKITLQELENADAHYSFLSFYSINNLQEIDWDSIHTINFNDKYYFFEWFVKEFKISLKNIYNGMAWEFDEFGNIIYHKDIEGLESWYEFDNGREIYFKDSNGSEYWRKFDEFGNLLYYKESNGYTENYEYNENGKLIRVINSFGNEKIYEYDANGNNIHFKSDNNETWRKYNSQGQCTYYKDSTGIIHHYEYDKNGNCIFCNEEETGYSFTKEYDDQNNLISFRDISSNQYKDAIKFIN